MPKCGILLENLLPSQQSFYFVNYANQMMEKSIHNTFTFFLEDIVQPIFVNPVCPVMNSTEVGQFNNGVIITTTINHTLQAINEINNSKVKFYVMDLDWLRKPSDYFSNLTAFRHKKVEVIARSDDHAKMIANYANIQPPKVVEHCNLEEILSYDILTRTSS